MPDLIDKPRDEWTRDDYRDHTEDARRAARFKFAETRIRKIVAAAPPLTAEQRERLALLLTPAGDSDAA